MDDTDAEASLRLGRQSNCIISVEINMDYHKYVIVL